MEEKFQRMLHPFGGELWRLEDNLTEKEEIEVMARYICEFALPYDLYIYDINTEASFPVDCTFTEIPNGAVCFKHFAKSERIEWIGINHIGKSYVVGMRLNEDVPRFPMVYLYKYGNLWMDIC